MSVARWRLLMLVPAVALVAAACTVSGTPVPSPSSVAPPTGPSGTTGGTTSPTPTTQAAADNPALDVCDTLGLMPCARQVAQFSLPIAGTDIALTYSSDRAQGRSQDQAPSAAGVGLDGWTLSVLDSLDPASKKMITGDGTLRKVIGVVIGGSTAVADRSGGIVDLFDSKGRATAVMNATTGAMLETFQWGDHGLASVSDSSGVVLSVVRAADGTPSRLDTTKGASTYLGVTGGQLDAVRYPDGSKATITASLGGLVSEIVDRTGAASQYEYDPEGRLASSTDGTGARTSYTRQISGNTLNVTTVGPAGGSTVDSVSLDGASTTWSHTDAAGAISSLAANGDQLTMTDPDGTSSSTTLAPDPRWGLDAPLPAKVVSGASTVTLTSTVSPGATGSLSAIASSVVSKTWSVNGKTWKFGWDGATSTATQTDPDGATRTAAYDATGRVATSAAPGQAPIAYGYGPQGRITSITVGTGPDARTWTYAYSGHTVTVTDPIGGVQQQVLTATGALSHLAGPGGAGVDLPRDSSDRIIGFAAPAGGAYRVTWGANGQVAAVNSPAGAGAPQFTGFDYDKSGNLIRQFTSDTSVTVSRDSAGRVQSYNAGAGDVAAAYDKAGRPTTITSTASTISDTYTGATLTGETVAGPVRTALTRTVDSLGRTVDLDLSGGVGINFGYDAAGHIEAAGDLKIVRDPATSLVSSETLGSLTATFTYNQFGEQLSEKVTAAGGQQVALVVDTRDKVGRITSVSTTTAGSTGTAGKAGVTAYSYDSSGRLASESTAGVTTVYAYDAAGNLSSVTDAKGVVTKYAYDGRNALVRKGDTTYTYDGAGQLATATSPAGTTTYHYDGAGRLLSVARPGQPAIAYTVDGLGRRIATSVGGKITGALAYLDILRPAAELDPSGKVLKQYVYSGSSTTPAYVTASGTDYLEVPDATGGPALVIDSGSGAITDAVVRTALGAVVSETDPGFQSIGYAGGIVDPNTDLVRFGARDYDTTSGRWTAPDPLSVGGGSANLYEHVNGDPVNQHDPTGQCDYTSVGGSFGGGFGPAFGSVSFGFATAGGQLGFYGSYGGGVGFGGGGGVVLNCLNQDKPTDTPPGLDPFGGAGRSADGSIGPFSGGTDTGQDNNGNPYSHGGHIGFGVDGTGVGGSVTSTHTDIICLLGCPPPPPTVCGNLGCDSSPSDKNSAPPDDSSNLPSGSGARTTGDPHMRTADQTSYNLMAVGEFTWATSDTGTLDVQVRQQPIPGSRAVSINTAVAMSVNGDHLLVTDPGGFPQNLAVSMAGSALPGVGTFTLPHGAVAVRTETMLTVTMADGTKLWVYTNPKGLDLNALFATSLQGHIHGLAGPFTGAYTGQVQTRSGVTLTSAQLQDYNTLYRTFGDSWRITQAQSLFQDDPGKDATAFDDPTFPDRNVPGPSAAALAAAKAICTQLDVSAGNLPDCIEDVALTGDAGFASSLARGTDTVPGSSSSTPAVVAGDQIGPGQTVHGTVTAGGKTTFGFTVPAGTVAYFAAGPNCVEPAANKGSIIWNLDSSDGSTFTGGSEICSDQGRVVFTKGGAYSIVVASYDGGSGPFSLVWRSSRPDLVKPLTAGSTVSGDIDLPGAHDVYTVTVAAGTVGYFAAAPRCAGPATGSILWYLLDQTGLSFTGASEICSDQGRVVFRTAGTYQLVIASTDGATGRYSLTWKVSRPDLIKPLTAGGTVTGTIDLPGAHDIYTIAVTAGTVGYFAAAADCKDPSASQLYWYINGPDGGTFKGSTTVCNDLGRVVFPSAGTYQVVVTSYDGATGPYSLSWKQSRPDHVQPLAIGSTVSGNLDLPGANDVWTFDAAANSKINFTAGADCTTQNIYWQIRTAGGDSVTGGQNLCSDLRDITFPTAGGYQLLVSGYLQTAGSYSFTSAAG